LFLSVARSGADGAWSLRAPLASSAARSFNLRLWPGEDSCPDVLELDALRIWETNAVELRASATRSRIEGVLNLEGAGLSGAQILLYRKGQKSAATFYPPASTDAGGRFAFERVPEGAYVLEVVHPRAGRASFPAPCPGEPLRLEVPAAPGGAVECFLKISVDGKPVADATAARKAADGVSPALFAAGTDGRPRSPLVPLAIGEVREGGWFFRVENLPEGDHAFVFLDVGAVKGPEALKDVDEATFPLWGGLFLHEGRRAIPSDPPLSKIGIELKAKVRRGETAKIDVRREFTAKEVLAWQELASR
jgi:hypothetical protein